jgi:hypothetical protein
LPLPNFLFRYCENLLAARDMVVQILFSSPPEGHP